MAQKVGRREIYSPVPPPLYRDHYKADEALAHLSLEIFLQHDHYQIFIYSLQFTEWQKYVYTGISIGNSMTCSGIWQ